MSYLALTGAVLGAGMGVALVCMLLHKLVHHERFRRYHELGYVVFLQLGVVFAVLLAFVFNDVWLEYGTAAEAINRECASLHGIAILGDRLPPPDRTAVLQAVRTYLTTVVDREWPDMQQRRGSRAASQQFQALWQTVATIRADGQDSASISQMLTLLTTAHQSRETRLFQMSQGVPDLVWGMLVIFAAALVGCMLVFAAEASVPKATFVGVFTCALTLALLTVHILDYPFENALQLSSQDFQDTRAKVDGLIAVAR